MAKTKSNLNEFKILKAILEHPAGFNIDIFGLIGIRSTEQGKYIVWKEFSSDEWYEYEFENIKDAIEFFIELRNEHEIGVDIESKLFKNIFAGD